MDIYVRLENLLVDFVLWVELEDIFIKVINYVLGKGVLVLLRNLVVIFL